MGKSIVIAFAILVLGIGGCASQGSQGFAADTVRRASQLEQQGQKFRAAEAYLAALQSQPGNRDARAGLSRVVDPAVEEKLLSATALESELRLDAAIAEIDAARRLLRRSATIGIDSHQTAVVESRRSQLINDRVQELVEEAGRMRREGLWSAALANLNTLEALSPGREETSTKLQRLWVQWAESNMSEGRLRGAAERFEAAAGVPGGTSGVYAARAAAIRSVIGLSALQQGACRAALVELRAAERLAPGSTDPVALNRAVTCSRTCVQLRTDADGESGVSENGRRLLSSESRRQVMSGASEFILVENAGADVPKGCDRRLVPGADGQPLSAGSYSVLVHVSATSVIRQPATSSIRQTRTWLSPQVESVVAFHEYREVLSGTISGWVTVEDQSGSARVRLPIRVSDQTVSRWQGAPISTATNRVGVTGQTTSISTGVTVSTSGRGRSQADQARQQAGEQLNTMLIQRFAAEAAQRLLATVDAEPLVPDPTELPQ